MVTAYKGQKGVTVTGGTHDGLRFDDCEDVVVDGATLLGPEYMAPGAPWVPGGGYGLHFVRCKRVAVKNCALAGFKVGVVVHLTDGFAITGNAFSRMRADGIDFAESWNGLIEGNSFRDPRIVAGVHPDPIQGWSRATSRPCADVVIRRNRIMGDWQGVGLFNHIRPYKAGTRLADGRVLLVTTELDDGGFDRITIEENEIEVGYPQAISLMSGRDSAVRRNRVRTLVGSRSRASINTGPGVVREANIVFPGARKAGLIEPGAIEDPLAEVARLSAELVSLRGV